MFANDIALPGTSATVTYSLIDVTGGNSIRRDSASELDSPKSLIIKNEKVTKAGGQVSDRHLVRLERVVLEEGSTVPLLLSAHLVLEVPRSASIYSGGQVQDIIDQLESFLGVAGNITKLLNGEP